MFVTQFLEFRNFTYMVIAFLMTGLMGLYVGMLVVGLRDNTTTVINNITNGVEIHEFQSAIGNTTANFTLNPGATRDSYYSQLGKQISVNIFVSWSNTSNITSGSLVVLLPLPIDPNTQIASFSIGFINGINFVNQIIAAGNGIVESLNHISLISMSSSSPPVTVAIATSSAFSTGEIALSGTYFTI